MATWLPSEPTREAAMAAFAKSCGVSDYLHPCGEKPRVIQFTLCALRGVFNARGASRLKGEPNGKDAIRAIGAEVLAAGVACNYISLLYVSLVHGQA